MKVYISGPMTGIPEYNRDAFMTAEARLRKLGHLVENPWRLGAQVGWGHFQYMRRDIRALSRCSAIHMLPGWWRSRGARKEWVVARWVLGLGRIR